jgi:predicted RNA-binding Zn-ribbon protein involved in translation (DUF1610 family)
MKAPTVPGEQLEAAIARALTRTGETPTRFAERARVSTKARLDWRNGAREATWDQAEKVLVALGLHWWDVWPPDTEAGKIAHGLWEGEPALVVACPACGLEDARAAASAAEAEVEPCPQCGGAVHVVVDTVAA